MSSNSDPQYVVCTDASYGTVTKLTGNVPRAMPTIVTSPPIRTEPDAIPNVASAPTKSTTSSAPLPLVAALTRDATSSSAFHASSAPTARASSSLESAASTAMTRAGVSARKICTAMWPRPPIPITTAVVPGTSDARDRAIA